MSRTFVHCPSARLFHGPRSVRTFVPRLTADAMNIDEPTMETVAKAGLEDVVAASSSICYLDGEHGVLAYRGYDIHDLADHASFEEVCYLLWHGRLPSRAELGELQSQLAVARPLPEGILRLIRSLPPAPAMDVLRTLVSALS